MKPTWDIAPEWANYLTMDEDGTWAWHEDLPYKTFGLYDSSSGFWASDKRQEELPINWENSLEKRNEN